MDYTARGQHRVIQEFVGAGMGIAMKCLFYYIAFRAGKRIPLLLERESSYIAEDHKCL